MSAYRWRDGFDPGADPEAVGQEVTALAAKTRQPVSPERLVEAARESNGALHQLFEWDDARAASAQRIGYATQVLRNLIVVKVRIGDAPAGVPDRVVSQPRVVTPVDRATVAAKMRAAEVQQGLGELRRWRERYRAYRELAVCCAAIDVALRRVQEGR